MGTNRTNITATIAAGSTTSPYYISVNMTKRLCATTCRTSTPVFAPLFAIQSVAQVAPGQYVATIRVQGTISYDPCGTGCCARCEPVNTTFTIPFASATAPTSVTITAGGTVNAMSGVGCGNCGRAFVSETPLTLTIA